MAELSGICFLIYHCCVKSCCAYTGPFESLEKCPYCGEDHYSSTGSAWHVFEYIPLAPHFLGFFSNPRLVEKLSYWAEYKYDSDTIGNVFDGLHYQNLLRQEVTIDGIPCGHHFFSDPWDIAFGIMHDGFQIYKHACGSSASCTPIIALNFNIDQLECTHLLNIIPICLIPGPKAPQDLNSFIQPLIDECKQLAAGICAFDSCQDEGFVLHAYPISAHSNMHTMKHLLCLKGHNGICPCRMCKIQAIQDVTGGGMTYYAPLCQPHQCGLPASSWDLRHLHTGNKNTIKEN